jgi:hypothetical protein
MVWDALNEACEARGDLFVKRVLSSLLSIFTVKYTTAVAKKRRYILYMAVELLTEPVVNTTVEIVANKEVLANVMDKIDNVYKQIKKHEQRGTTDYLFAGLDDGASFQQTVQRLDIMASVDAANL